MIYNDTDLKQAADLRKKYIIILACATMLFILLIVLSSTYRLAWLGYISAVLFAVFSVFVWGTKIMPSSKYYHFLRDIDQGLEKTTIGYVLKIETDASIKDMLEYNLVLFMEESAEQDTPPRKLYIDISKKLPEHDKSTKVKLYLFGNFIKGIEII